MKLLHLLCVPLLLACNPSQEPNRAHVKTATSVLESKPADPAPVAAAGKRVATTTSNKLPDSAVANLALKPQEPTAADTLELSFDVPTGARSEIRWYRNGELIEEAAENKLTPGLFRRGDKVYATVSGQSDVMTFGPVKTREVTVQNRPPKITSKPSGSLDGYQVVAEDPDQDPVTFSIEDPPRSVTISAAGKLSWSGKLEPGEKMKIKIVARDDSDGIAVQEIPVIGK